MGPSLALMARRASELAGIRRRIIGVARFSSAGLEAVLQRYGIETIHCGLLDEAAVQQLPEARNVLYLAGMKFGATGQESLTWAMNTHLPAIVCRKFARSRIVAFSTGNVYGLVPATGGGSLETDVPGPVGEYAMSCLGRERVFEHFSRSRGTRVGLVRLNYACDLRYGVVVDLAQKVLAGAPVDLGMSWFNTIWQGDANRIALECLPLASSPPFVVNVTGLEMMSVRELAEWFGERFGKRVQFTGNERADALLSNTSRMHETFAAPEVSLDQMREWVAQWIEEGGPLLGKATKFEARDGRF